MKNWVLKSYIEQACSKSLFSEAAYREMDVGSVEERRSNHSSKNTKVH